MQAALGGGNCHGVAGKRVAALPEMVRANALLEVARFDNFTPDNDPHGEHDFGNFKLVGRTFYKAENAESPIYSARLCCRLGDGAR
jgi:Protein of unknown function (DUF3768)